MDSNVIGWIVIGLMGAFFVYTRFVGKTSPADARALVANGALLLDVRTPGEYGMGHIEGAKNIPVDELGRRIPEVGAKDRPVVVYCRSGARSARAVAMLKQAGYARVEDLGPMSRW
jgi:rhodanese-related sulfurtransferase